MEVIRKQFTPEFRNRLDAIIQFDVRCRRVGGAGRRQAAARTRGAARRQGRQSRGRRRRPRNWLAENGYDEKMGARPDGTLIQDRIKRPLADELAVWALADGGVAW
jgi:ATP-dependent Clp protease ATP-binding subunit ClpA